MSQQHFNGTERALPIGGKIFHVIEGRVYDGPNELPPGLYAGEGGPTDFIGAGRIDGGGFAFAVSDGESGRVSRVFDGRYEAGFLFETRGRAEAHFIGGYVFISPMHGDASAYTLDGRFVRSFSYSGYLAEVFEVGEYIAAGYVSSASERYSLLLKPGGLETAALLPGFLGETDTGMLILDSGASLNAVSLMTTPELVDMAAEYLGARVLSPEEIEIFRAG